MPTLEGVRITLLDVAVGATALGLLTLALTARGGGGSDGAGRPREPDAHARLAQPRRHPGDDRLDDLRPRLDGDRPPAVGLHLAAQAPADARVRRERPAVRLPGGSPDQPRARRQPDRPARTSGPSRTRARPTSTRSRTSSTTRSAPASSPWPRRSTTSRRSSTSTGESAFLAGLRLLLVRRGRRCAALDRARRSRLASASTTTPPRTRRRSAGSTRRSPREGLTESTLTLRWDETAPTDDPRPGRRHARDRGRDGERRDGRARSLPAPLDGVHGRHEVRLDDRSAGLRQHRADPGVRRLDGGGRRRVPDRPPLRRHERVQPAALREPAVRRDRREPVGRDLRARARSRLRRAQGRRARRTSSGASASRRAATTTRTPRATSRPRRRSSSPLSAPGSRPRGRTPAR